jgi:hypothetical protein
VLGDLNQHRFVRSHEGYPGIEIRVSAVGPRQLNAGNSSRPMLLRYGSHVKTFDQLLLIYLHGMYKTKLYRASRVCLPVCMFKFHNRRADLYEVWYGYCCWVPSTHNF